MTLPKHLLILAIFGLILFNYGYPQGEHIEKSIITESIDGKEYYLHFVKEGQTLFNIARTYGVTTDDIFRDNPGSSQGIVDGQILKIRMNDDGVDEVKKPQQSGDNYFYHIVTKQETLYGISRKYGVSIDDITKINPDMGEYPKEGETLKIPVIHDDMGLIESEWEGETITHTVQQGETLYGIAKEYNITIGEIKNANPGLGETLSIGNTLVIPNQVEEIVEEEPIDDLNANTLETHEVMPGETLYGIARVYAVSIDTLKKYNTGLSSNISPGQVIIIPEITSDISYIVHKPGKSESLEGISQLYDVELNELKELNPGMKRKAKKGQTVKIPVEPRVPEEVINHAEEEPEAEDEYSHCFDGEKHKGNIYNIALMLPLFLEEIDSTEFDNEIDFEALSGLLSFRFVNFYAGFKMALDSMVNNGMKVNLFVYDVDNDIRKAENVLFASELSSMDLIVGPFYLAPFRKVADFAKTYHIPIINPLSRREELIYNNPFVFKLKPSEEQQIDLLVEYLETSYPTDNIILLRNNKYKYQKEISYIRNTINSHRPTYTYIPNDLIYEAYLEQENAKNLFTENKIFEPDYLKDRLTDSSYLSNLVREIIYLEDSITGLSMNLSHIRRNIIVAITDEIVFSKELLSQLNKLNHEYDITLFGLPTWNEYTDLETSHLLNLNVHTFTPSLVDYDNIRIQEWIKKYRELYNTEPSRENYAYDGFDAGWYFLNALYYYGRDFSACLQYLSIPLLQTQFEFEQSPGNGYQNIYWNLGDYQNYQYKKVYLMQE